MKETAAHAIRERAARLIGWSSLRSPAGRFVLGYLRPFRNRLAVIAGLAVVQSAIDGARMVLLLALIRWMLAGQEATMRTSVLGLPMSLPIPPSWLLPVTLASVVLLEAVDAWRKHLSAVAQRDVVERLRADTMGVLLRQPVAYFTETRSGAAAYLINSQVSRFSLFLPMASDLVGQVCTLGILTGLLAWMRPTWTLAVGLVVFALWQCCRPLYGKLYRLGLEIASMSTEAAAIVQDAIRGIKLVKVCRTEDLEARKATVASMEVASRQVLATDWRNLIHGIHRGGLVVSVVVLAGLAAKNGAGLEAMAFLLLLLRLLPIVVSLADAKNQVASAWGHVLQIAEFEAEPSSGGIPRDGVLSNSGLVGVCALDLWFRHGDTAVLNGVSVGFRQGVPTAIVGLTGSGKTTLLDILSGIREPEAGTVTVLRPDQETVIEAMYLTQDPILLYGTVYENATYPTHEGPVHPLVELHLDTGSPVGEAGGALSGGQKQMVALGRLYGSEAKVWLLDEPTASLDAQAEAEWLEWILEEAKARVVVMATHKLALARQFPRIVVLRNGKIEDDGTHEELVIRDGLYERLWKLQEVT